MIGVLGCKFSGKDTIADYIVKNYNYTKVSFAKPLKDICKILFNFTDSQLYGDEKEIIDSKWGISPRTAFQFIGTEVFRNKISEIMPETKDNFWVNLCMNNCKNSKSNIIIADVRFQNEIDAIKKNNGIIIKIIRPNLNLTDNHESESIANLKGDIEVYNDGSLEDLYKKIDDIFLSL